MNKPQNGRLAGVNVISPDEQITKRAFGAVDSAEQRVTKCHVLREVALERKQLKIKKNIEN